MARTHKFTFSVKEFSHLVSESLDIAHATPSQSLIENIAVFSEAPQKTSPRPSFQRIFSRPTPELREDSPQGPPEDLSEAPRKMIGWPFSRSPRKNRPTKDEGNATQDVNDPDTCHSTSPYSVSSPAAASTSSLGSLVPAHERLFQLTCDSNELSQNCHEFNVASSSPVTITPPHPCQPPTASGCYAVVAPLRAIYGSLTRTSFQGTEASLSVANSVRESFDEDPTPRASTFGPRAPLPAVDIQDDPFVCLLYIILVARSSSPTFPTTRLSDAETSSPRVPSSTPPNARISAISLGIASPSNMDFTPPVGLSPRQRKRAMSRSLTPPPLPRPPPTGPLPAVPSSVPPVPPLPPLLSKLSMNMSPNAVISSTPRSTMTGAPVNPATALPLSPPGGLRLPSRLSWVNSVRAVLPSPPASPTRSVKSLTGKLSLPMSPSKSEKKPSPELKRPTSIGVIEAADNTQVRRTKSILLLGSRSKSNASLGTKRVQIHADVNLDVNPTPKPRRKSSAATVGHPIFSSDSGSRIISMQSSELLVLRERRHSAPVLSVSSADWTLSLPFCTDTPGNQLLPSPLLTPEIKPEEGVEEVQGDDWTLCMPLKVRADSATVESADGPDSERTAADTLGTVETQSAVQLPTPSPSPTWPTPTSVLRSLDLDEDEDEPVPEDRPASPVSLGPHVGGLDLAGGRGKRASGWHVYGWFDQVDIPGEDDDDDIAPMASPVVSTVSDSKLVKSHVTVFRKVHDAAPSQDSMSTVSTSGTAFYSARSSLLVN
ncbi:hypothetical protein JVT61DRAFT_6877 [Boletus reticuloceps]|uniref:Uncharacterized protein n=1 Tax=Boletus reticuloceps TaxID=495285 RepID=A0A8I3A7S6_9AGAM|nr:hypothetical protein JVT61DRAFT_6877 [Boletus reticuloceps]